MPCAKNICRKLTLIAGLFTSMGSGAFADITFDFDTFKIGQAPANWHSSPDGIEAWQVVPDITAPSGGQVLSMVGSNGGIFSNFFGGTFNLIYTDTPLLNGEIEVSFRAISGGTDQRGGIMWRVQDAENYYVARFNPLEDNFRIYIVDNGSRRQLNSFSIHLGEDWHMMKIIQNGNRYSGYLDGVQHLAGSDDLITESGGVGLWTKADAVTSFDNLVVRATGD